MEIYLFGKGILLGLSIAAPVGPIGVLCIRRTLASGFGNGFASGMGAATADAFYGAVAAFGITVISNFLLDNRIYLHVVGGAFLLYLGYKTFVSRPAEEAAQAEGQGLWGAYTSTLALTLTNPLTIMLFLAIFAGMGVGETSYLAAAIIVLGVFLGSALWWLILSGGMNYFRDKITSEQLGWVNKISGAIIFGFGVSSLLQM